MRKLEKTDKFMEVINSINYDVEKITHRNYGDNNTLLNGMSMDLDIMRFKLQWKIFEHFKPNGDIDVCLDKNIHDKKLLPIYKSIMHSDIPTWREVKDELLEEIPNLNETRNYVQWYKTMFYTTLSDVLDLDDFRNNPNHNVIRKIKKISPDIVAELYLTDSIDNILVCLNNWVKEFVTLMDEWCSGAPEISNQGIELVTSTPQYNNLIEAQASGASSTLTIGELTVEQTENLFKLVNGVVFKETSIDFFVESLNNHDNNTLNICTRGKAKAIILFHELDSVYGIENIISKRQTLLNSFNPSFDKYYTAHSGSSEYARLSPDFKTKLNAVFK